MSDSGLNVSKLPELADADGVESQARDIRSAGGKVSTTAVTIDRHWQRLAPHFVSPDTTTLTSALKPAVTDGDSVKKDADSVAKALEEYARTERTLQQRKTTLIGDVASFDRSIEGDDDWHKDEDKVKAQQDLVKRMDQLVADHTQAETTCANAINTIFGGVQYRITDASGAAPAQGQEAYGYTKDVLDSASGAGQTPWGKPAEWDKPWYRDLWDGVKSFGSGLWESVKGTVMGLAALVNPFDWKTFSTTWKGVGTLALDVTVATSPVAMALMPERARESRQRLKQVGSALLNVEEWKRNPAKAAGMLTGDVLQTIIPVGGGVKAASMAGKAGRVVGRAGQIASKLGVSERVVVKATDAAVTKINTVAVKIDDVGDAVKASRETMVRPVARVAAPVMERIAPQTERASETVVRHAEAKYSGGSTDAAAASETAGQGRHAGVSQAGGTEPVSGRNGGGKVVGSGAAPRASVAVNPRTERWSAAQQTELSKKADEVARHSEDGVPGRSESAGDAATSRLPGAPTHEADHGVQARRGSSTPAVAVEGGPRSGIEEMRSGPTTRTGSSAVPPGQLRGQRVWPQQEAWREGPVGRDARADTSEVTRSSETAHSPETSQHSEGSTRGAASEGSQRPEGQVPSGTADSGAAERGTTPRATGGPWEADRPVHRTVGPNHEEVPRRYQPHDVEQALRDAPRNAAGEPVDHRTGQPLHPDGDHGRRWHMMWDAEDGRWVPENPGRGLDDGNFPLRGEPNSYGYDENGFRMEYANHRPSYRKGLVEAVWRRASYRGPDGKQYVDVLDRNGDLVQVHWDPSSGMSRRGVWDMGHVRKHKYSMMLQRYLNHELDSDPVRNKDKFIEWYNSPENYEVQHPSRNRAHVDE